jgi:A/G-specific adenine glycosylase
LFRRRLLAWFDAAKRDLPWRRTRDPYRIWLSEIMLQQTRVAAAEPYYHRFLERFPTVNELAAAPEEEVLTAWAGLGYYSRARNLHKAAQKVAAQGRFSNCYEDIRGLPGVGDYTAAAVASIAFGLPHAALDGNVMRVLARVECESGDIQSKRVRDSLRLIAQELLDPQRPGDFNQAMMELGATVCIPGDPRCLVCPVAAQCQAREKQLQRQLPVKLRAIRQLDISGILLIIVQGDSILLWQRPAESSRMPGFWELPEASRLPQAKVGRDLGIVRHTITFHKYTFSVHEATVRSIPDGYKWVSRAELAKLPASTILRKALALT